MGILRLPSDRIAGIAVIAMLLCFSSGAWASDVLFQESFEDAALDGVPGEFFVLTGDFKVREDAGNRFLELPGTPLDQFGVLFGPTRKEGVRVSARVRSSRTGRRYPALGIGTNGVGGFQLRISPARRSLELFRDEERVAETPFRWESGEWYRMEIRTVAVGSEGAAWEVAGRVWRDGEEAPKDWQIRHRATGEPYAGRAVLYAVPYAGTAIQFDDLEVAEEAGAGKED